MIDKYKVIEIPEEVTMREAIDKATPHMQEDENVMVIFKNKFIFRQPATPEKICYLCITGDPDPLYPNTAKWDVSVINGKVTVHPSIKITMHDLGIEHFFIRNGKVQWCRDSYIFNKK